MFLIILVIYTRLILKKINYYGQKIIKFHSRSKHKTIGNKLIAANQNNDLYFFDKNSGDILKMIPTEETTVKNEFVNNISCNLKYTIFLNTYGSFMPLIILL